VSVYGVTFHKLGNRPELKVAGGNPWKSTSKDSGFEFSVEDMASAMIRFDNGAVLQVECSFDANIEQDVGNVELLGTKAGVKISPEIELFTEMAGYMVNVKPAGSSKLSFDGLFESEIAHFVDCVANGTQCVSPAHDGVILMQILDAIYESGRTGHEVLIGD